MNDRGQLYILLNKYLDKQCTAEEIRYLLNCFNLPENEEALKTAILRYLNKSGDENASREPGIEEAVRAVHANLISQLKKEKAPAIRKLNWRRAAAAVVFLAASAGIFLYLQKERSPSTDAFQVQSDVAPGGNKATLILGDGTRIVLDEAAEGELAEQAGSTVSKMANGQILYDRSGAPSAYGGETTVFNTIETPRGGQYQVRLPDGSKVWLNAASSLRYPAVFKGKARKVELKGEAYFEVRKAGMPFQVITESQTVEVLGTSFNINAYADEAAVRTTLAEGSVQVNRMSPGGQHSPIVLKPGQESLLSRAGNSIKVQEADMETALAWKNGDFIFKEEDLMGIMRKIARWYDVEVEYRGGPGEAKFSGWVSRSRNLSVVLKTMELTGKARFKVEGRRIIVMP